MGRQATEVRKLGIFFAAGAAMFLVAMALGMSNVPFVIGAGVCLLTTVTAAVVAARRSAPAAVAEPSAPAPKPRTLAVHLHEEFVDLDLKVRWPPRRQPGEPAEGASGHEPDVYDQADYETPRPAPASTADPRDSEIELIIGPEIPLQRAQPTIRVPQGAAARGGTGLDAGLPVADLARSVHFYQDLLGFTVAYSTPDSAVVECDGLRLLLDRIDDPAGRAPRVGAVSLDVTDIEVACRTLAAFGVVVTEPPAPVGQGLWRARLRDPDGHEVELLEFRGPSPSPPSPPPA